MAAKSKLTSKQEAFCQAVISGKTLSDSYRMAYDADKMKDSSVHQSACRLAADLKIAARIDALRGELERVTRSAALSDRELVLQRLRKFSESAEPSDMAKIRATELLGRSCALFTDVVEDKRQRTAEEVRRELGEKLAMLADPADSDKVH